MENDRASREGEIRLVENITSRTTEETEQVMLRRSLVLLTYAHLEGFCKFALMAYAAAVNAAKLPCREASTAVAAATLSRLLAALRDVNSKHAFFARKLPDDRSLHLLARERAFVEGLQVVMAERVEIPEQVVDTRSNLNSIVLKRNLYQLGLEYPLVDAHASTIDKLLGVRNAIAHGDSLKTPSDADTKSYVAAAFDVMRFVQNEVYKALVTKAYQRAVTEVTAPVSVEQAPSLG